MTPIDKTEAFDRILAALDAAGVVDHAPIVLAINVYRDIVVKNTYLDAAAYCQETASEHTTNLYGKSELEMVAVLLTHRANGTEIREDT